MLHFDNLETLGLFKNDLIIAFNSRQISKTKRVLTAESCQVFMKDETGYQQVGFIQDMRVSANTKKALAEVSMTFPKKTTHDISKRKKELAALGVTVQ
jgi:hypothetical protein